MSGLLLKDLLNLKRQGRIYLVTIALYVALALFQQDVSFLAWMLVFLSMMSVVNAMAYDENARWDRYALTMPVTRRDMVLSKYLLSLICLGVSGAAALAASLAFGASPDDAWRQGAMLLGGGVGYLSLILPLMFRLGVQKARVAMTLAFVIPLLLVVRLNPDAAALSAAAWMLPAAAPVLLAASASLSCRFYARRSF